MVNLKHLHHHFQRNLRMRLTDLSLSNKDSRVLSGYINNTPQSLLLSAEAGFGKYTVAKALAHEIVNGREFNVFTVSVLPDVQSISIEQSREIKKFFSLKTNDRGEKRVVIIENAETMTTEAQNALLKVLEEPPENCYLLLTSAKPWRLLPTIISRLQVYSLATQSQDEIKDYFLSKNYSPVQVQSAMDLAGSLVGLVSSILAGDKSVLVESIKEAKAILGMTMLERLKVVDKLSKDRFLTEQRINAIKVVAVAVLSSSIKSAKNTDKWASVLQKSSHALDMLEQNASAKLVLTDLLLSL